MERSCTVLIAARDLLDPLRQRLGKTDEVLSFADSEPLRALETINERRPTTVALERLFAASPRGAALINRIKADPLLGETEIVVLSHENNSSRTVHRATEPLVKAPEDRRGTRRAPRVKIKPGVEVTIDGNNAALIDLSTVGAQVLSRTWLRPNTRVRVAMNEAEDNVRVGGQVAWARFEIPGGTGEPRYRCGIEFTDGDKDSIEKLCARWKIDAESKVPTLKPRDSKDSKDAKGSKDPKESNDPKD